MRAVCRPAVAHTTAHRGRQQLEGKRKDYVGGRCRPRAEACRKSRAAFVQPQRCNIPSLNGPPSLAERANNLPLSVAASIYVCFGCSVRYTVLHMSSSIARTHTHKPTIAISKKKPSQKQGTVQRHRGVTGFLRPAATRDKSRSPSRESNEVVITIGTHKR